MMGKKVELPGIYSFYLCPAESKAKAQFEPATLSVDLDLSR